MELVDFDKVFRSHQGKAPVIINDVPAFSETDKDKLNRIIFTTFSGDLLSNIPACDCGKTSGEYNMHVMCRTCNTPVQQLFDQDLIPLTWIRSPEGVAKLMNPLVWTMLKNSFTISSFNIIHWLCDTTYHPTTNPPPVLSKVREILINGVPIERGYNYFVTNFEKIITELMELKYFRTAQKNPRQQMRVLRKLLEHQRSRIFSDYLPIPHRSLLVVEENNLGVYVDPITTGAIDAIQTLAGIDTGFHVYSLRTRENRTVKTIDQLADFYEATYKDTLSRKEGIFRKHVFATRSHFSFRAVITSITDAHNYDEIYIPWGVATAVLRIHLMNKLTKLGYTPNEGIAFINEHAQKYDPLLDRLFDEIIQESPNGRGISCLLNRNPSLARGSIQHVYITKVKKDPAIPTVSISILIVRGLNADFDGDATQFSIAVDQKVEKELKYLAPHMSAFGMNSPRVVSDNLAMPKPVVSTIANWLDNIDATPDEGKLEKMKQLLGAH